MKGIRRNSIAAALIALGGAWLWAPPDHALSTKPMNLSDLVRGSSQIVVGTVSAVNQGIGTNHLPYTDIEVKVSDSIRGTAVSTLTFRQFGLQSALPAESGRRYAGAVAGMPQYKSGEQVVLFLSPASSIGYRTTIGFGQGKFSLRGGNLTNEVNNSGLFQNLDLGTRHLNDKEKHLVTTSEGVVGADTFVNFVRRAVDGKWWNGSRRVTAPRRKANSSTPHTVRTDGGSTHD